MALGEPLSIMRDAIPQDVIDFLEERFNAPLDFIVEDGGYWYVWCEGYPGPVARRKIPEDSP